jgi:hypothetical protein
VAQPVRPLTDIRAADTTGYRTGSPEDVGSVFHVSRYIVEPSAAERACNLLPKDDVRPTLADKIVENGPKVPLVEFSSPLASFAKGLAWQGRGPRRPIVRPTGSAQRVAPTPDSGEEVALSKSSKLGWNDIADISFINFPRRDMAITD